MGIKINDTPVIFKTVARTSSGSVPFTNSIDSRAFLATLG